MQNIAPCTMTNSPCLSNLNNLNNGVLTKKCHLFWTMSAQQAPPQRPHTMLVNLLGINACEICHIAMPFLFGWNIQWLQCRCDPFRIRSVSFSLCKRVRRVGWVLPFDETSRYTTRTSYADLHCCAVACIRKTTPPTDNLHICPGFRSGKKIGVSGEILHVFRRKMCVSHFNRRKLQKKHV